MPQKGVLGEGGDNWSVLTRENRLSEDKEIVNMGREVRRVPKDWEHPKDARGHFVPLFGGSFSQELKKWEVCNGKWIMGSRWDYVSKTWIEIENEYRHLSFDEWRGPKPVAEDYMPDWDEAERTHYMMYEDTSEGTPISPAFETPEELAQWLANNNASAFGSETATYEAWLRVCEGGYAPSMVVKVNEEGVRISSGVAVLD